jgi:hypothetical protein
MTNSHSMCGNLCCPIVRNPKLVFHCIIVTDQNKIINISVCPGVWNAAISFDYQISDRHYVRLNREGEEPNKTISTPRCLRFSARWRLKVRALADDQDIAHSLKLLYSCSMCKFQDRK